MKNLAEQAVGLLVANNFKTASVFSKYQIDFCCGGKKTLIEACIQKGINVNEVINDLNLLSKTNNDVMPFNEMSSSDLISYIIIHHHFYTKQHMPIILEHLQKVAFKHGEKFTYMPKVAQLFEALHVDMLQHMHKEETILFPAIKELAQQKTVDVYNSSNFILQIIENMEAEHTTAGDMLASIKELTNNFTPPEEACTTFRISLQELQDFE
nr:DUF542 domain-containing protein [Chitinophagaceae bacterium]